MSSQWLTVDDFVIRKNSKNWIIYRVGKPYRDYHGHRGTEFECVEVRDDIIAKVLPAKRGQRECARRLLSDDEYYSLRPQRKKTGYEDKHCIKKGRCFNK